MTYEVSDIVRSVRVAIDQNRRDVDLLSVDISTQLLDEGIVGSICDGCRIVLSAAPLSLLDVGSSFVSEVLWLGCGAGRVLLPADFLRLLSFQMSDWSYGVSELLSSLESQSTKLELDVITLNTEVLALQEDTTLSDRLSADQKSMYEMLQAIDGINAELVTYDRDKDRLSFCWNSLSSGRVNNGTERFDGV